MKTLLLYYSLTGKTEKVVENLRRFSPVEAVCLHEVRPYSILGAYTFGCLRAKRGTGSSLLPVSEDLTAYRTIVLSGPIWAGNPAPALSGFLRVYDLSGKEVHGLLTYASRAGEAAARLRRQIEQAGGVCASVATVKCDARSMQKIEKNEVEFIIAPGEGVLVQNPHDSRADE